MEYEDMYRNPRALNVPKEEKVEQSENDVVKDGYEREECSYNWEDNRRKHGGGGGRSF